MPNRLLTPYELNHLKKFGYSNLDLGQIGEKPVEYITGYAEFCDLDFLVNKSTLIPRLESEKLVQIALEHIIFQKISHPAIADIGTGSGCIGISLIQRLQRKQITYTAYLSDISPLALKIAQENSTKLLLSPANLFFETSDLFVNYPHIKFDVILANLPYIPSKNIAKLPSSVRDYEPLSALDGGPQGVTLIDRLLKDLPRFLSDNGIALLEIDDTHSLQGFSIPSSLTATITDDVFQIPRFLVLHQKQ